jgi:putative endonuclease
MVSHGTNRSRKDVLGRQGEEAAARYLTARLGWTILERNWRCPEGELDIIAYNGRRHIVCEVKTRATALFGTPFDAITPAKAARLRRLANRWAAEHGIRAATVQIDVIALTSSRSAARGGFDLDHLREVC